MHGSAQSLIACSLELRTGKPSHSLAVSRNVSIAESCHVLLLQALSTGKPSDYVVMKWKPEEDTILHLVPLSGKGPVRSFRAPKYFTFHYMNAFESGAARSINCCATLVVLE